MTNSIMFRDVIVDGQRVRFELQWAGSQDRNAPLMVFLHDGFGSLTTWRDYPRQLCETAGLRGLLFSREGHGRSGIRNPRATWGPNYLHIQAREVLPALLQSLNLEGEPVWLFGHSDGGSIALIHAAAFQEIVAGIVVLAPHIFVEDVTLEGIAKARVDFDSGELRARLSRHHSDPDRPFWRWHNAWTSPQFRDWNLEGLIPAIRCPVLAIQGYDDIYGTMAQIDRINSLAANVRLLKLPACGHAPHRDHPDEVTRAVTEFMRSAAERAHDGLS